MNNITAKVREMLVRGRDRINRAWASGAPYGVVPANRVCAVMALHTDPDTGTLDNYNEEVYLRARNLLTESLPKEFRASPTWSAGGDVIDWNDEQTSKKPVLALYDRALAKLG